MSILDQISDAELSDLRHKYRADAEVSRIIECLSDTRERLAMHESLSAKKSEDEKIEKFADSVASFVSSEVVASMERAVDSAVRQAVKRHMK